MGRRMRERMRRKSGVRRGLHTQMREGLRRRVASAHEGGQLPPACGVRQARTQSGSGDGRSEDPTGAKGSNTAAACAGVGGCGTRGQRKDFSGSAGFPPQPGLQRLGQGRAPAPVQGGGSDRAACAAYATGGPGDSRSGRGRRLRSWVVDASLGSRGPAAGPWGCAGALVALPGGRARRRPHAASCGGARAASVAMPGRTARGAGDRRSMPGSAGAVATL
mmetsp:Transcript_17613/g.55157  ORF Transcript_17613/g.55157 Transcript_17613/m.55157 type:complete len:220 (-) Transcript_17613:1470-2129(-)